MKELKDIRVAGKSTFLTLSAGLPASTSLAMFAGNSSAMRAGVEGTIVSIDYEEVQGLNTPFITADQVVSIGGEDVVLAKYVAGVETRPQAVTIRWDNGFTMTLGLLLQGQEKSTILFKGDTAPTKATDLTLETISAKLIDKKFKCTKYWRDASNPIVRNAGSDDPKRKERSYASNVYEFIETTA
jgi:hypothetical protein